VQLYLSADLKNRLRDLLKEFDLDEIDKQIWKRVQPVGGFRTDFVSRMSQDSREILEKVVLDTGGAEIGKETLVEASSLEGMAVENQEYVPTLGEWTKLLIENQSLRQNYQKLEDRLKRLEESHSLLRRFFKKF